MSPPSSLCTPEPLADVLKQAALGSRVEVVCGANNKRGLFLGGHRADTYIRCLGDDCCKNKCPRLTADGGSVMTAGEFERHAGCAQKRKWRSSVHTVTENGAQSGTIDEWFTNEAKRLGESLVGKRLQVYWTEEREWCWYSGTVIEFKASNGMHRVDYGDDKGHSWHLLPCKIWRLEPSTTECHAEQQKQQHAGTASGTQPPPCRRQKPAGSMQHTPAQRMPPRCASRSVARVTAPGAGAPAAQTGPAGRSATDQLAELVCKEKRLQREVKRKRRKVQAAQSQHDAAVSVFEEARREWQRVQRQLKGAPSQLEAVRREGQTAPSQVEGAPSELEEARRKRQRVECEQQALQQEVPPVVLPPEAARKEVRKVLTQGKVENMAGVCVVLAARGLAVSSDQVLEVLRELEAAGKLMMEGDDFYFTH